MQNYIKIVGAVFEIWAKNMKNTPKRGLATTVQPEPDFSRACGFSELLGINEDCLETKFHRNR